MVNNIVDRKNFNVQFPFVMSKEVFFCVVQSSSLILLYITAIALYSFSLVLILISSYLSAKIPEILQILNYKGKLKYFIREALIVFLYKVAMVAS